MRQRFRDEEKDCYLDEILEDKKIILNKLSRIMLTIRQEFPTCTHSLISFLVNHNLDEFYIVSINKNLGRTPPNLDSSAGHNDLLSNLSTTYIDVLKTDQNRYKQDVIIQAKETWSHSSHLMCSLRETNPTH